MKIAYYQDKKEYFLTDKEFEEALLVWQNKGNYYCRRLEVVLSPRFFAVETPREDLGYEVFLTKGSLQGSTKKVFKLGEKYFEHIFSNDDEIGRKRQIALTPEQISALIPQEKYYEGRKLLIS